MQHSSTPALLQVQMPGPTMDRFERRHEGRALCADGGPAGGRHQVGGDVDQVEGRRGGPRAAEPDSGPSSELMPAVAHRLPLYWGNKLL